MAHFVANRGHTPKAQHAPYDRRGMGQEATGTVRRCAQPGRERHTRRRLSVRRDLPAPGDLGYYRRHRYLRYPRMPVDRSIAPTITIGPASDGGRDDRRGDDGPVRRESERSASSGRGDIMGVLLNTAAKACILVTLAF